MWLLFWIVYLTALLEYLTVLSWIADPAVACWSSDCSADSNWNARLSLCMKVCMPADSNILWAGQGVKTQAYYIQPRLLNAVFLFRGSCLSSLDDSYCNTSGTAFVTYFVLNHQVFVVNLLTKECIKVIMRTILCVAGFVIMLPVCEHYSFPSRSRMMLSLLSSLLMLIHDMYNLLLLTEKMMPICCCQGLLAAFFYVKAFTSFTCTPIFSLSSVLIYKLSRSYHIQRCKKHCQCLNGHEIRSM